MRTLPPAQLEAGRTDGDPCQLWGQFKLGQLRIVSSGPADIAEAMDWEHVSVSLSFRCPTWEEMDRVKRLFWEDHETVIQFHPADDERKNFHPYCLHLWRHRDGHRLPPRILV